LTLLKLLNQSNQYINKQTREEIAQMKRLQDRNQKKNGLNKLNWEDRPKII